MSKIIIVLFSINNEETQNFPVLLLSMININSEMLQSEINNEILYSGSSEEEIERV